MWGTCNFINFSYRSEGTCSSVWKCMLNHYLDMNNIKFCVCEEYVYYLFVLKYYVCAVSNNQNAR